MTRRPQPAPVEPCQRCGDPEAAPYPELKMALCDDCLPAVQAKGKR